MENLADEFDNFSVDFKVGLDGSILWSNDIINKCSILKNCSVGLRLWCNTYCLQPYTALFVFVFMAATLHFSFFKGFFINTCFPPFFKIITLSLQCVY